MKKLWFYPVCAVLLLVLTACSSVPASSDSLSGGAVAGTQYLNPAPDGSGTVQEEADVSDPEPSPSEIPEGAIALTDVGDVEVSQWQKFSWNCTKGISEACDECCATGCLSRDGLWCLKSYDRGTGTYRNLQRSTYKYTSNPYYYAAGSVPGGSSYVRPGPRDDIVKIFTCPSGGTVRLETYLDANAVREVGNGSAFFVYLDNELVFPSDGSRYVHLAQDLPVYYEVTLDVKKNQNIYIHVGSIGNHMDGTVTMENTVVYKEINDEVAYYAYPLACTHERMSEWVRSCEPNCSGDGHEMSACLDCPYAKFRTVSPLGHLPVVSGNRKVCDRCGTFMN